MAAKQILFEGYEVPDLPHALTARQHEALVDKLASCPGCFMRAWQRTPKGWVVAEIAMPNDEYYKFRVDHRANVENARIERAPDGLSKYQQRYANDPDSHRHMVQSLWAKRRAAKSADS